MTTQRNYLESGIRCCREGRYDEAAAYFHRAVAFLGGSRDIPLAAAAASHLGYLHCQGLGLPKDPYTALQWNRQVAAWLPSDCGEVTRENIARLEELDPLPSPWPKTVEEPGLGRVIVKKTRSFCRVGRLIENALEVYVEPERPYDYAVSLAWGYVLDRLRFSALPEVLDERTRGDYPLFQWRIERGSEDRYDYRRQGSRYTIITPRDVRFDQLITRQAIIREGLELMRQAGEEYLTRRLDELSRKTGIPYTSCRIIRRRGSIVGTCYYREGRIVLSYDLMRYSPLQVDAVIVHELCHMIHHSHSKKFYEALRHYGGDDLLETNLKGITLLPPDEI